MNLANIESKPRPASARRTLNKLIVACREDALAEGDAARAVRDKAVAVRLREQARQRSAFIDDLGRGVRSLGGRPAAEASGMAWVRSIGRHLRALVGGWHEGDGYAGLVHAEERTARAYADALSGWLPDDARYGVKLQLARIEFDLEEARQARGRH
jgi:uncharacterized protein (TIGR02284 family)